jgi:hypothetical protein
MPEMDARDEGPRISKMLEANLRTTRHLIAGLALPALPGRDR